MVQGWGPLAAVCAVILLLAGSACPRHSSLTTASSATALVDPTSATYTRFNPASAQLKLVQVVFRHGARTPLNTIYTFKGANWSHCQDHYQGVEVELHDENGGPQPPPIKDADSPELPGGCLQGTLTEAGYGMARDLGSQLRERYVEGSGPTAGFLPDLTPATAAGPAGGAAGAAFSASVATLRTTTYRRTVATLRGLLTGLWPRLADPAAAEGAAATRLRAQAVLPVGASVEDLEIMYGNNKTCPRLTPLYDALQRDLDAADDRSAELPQLSQKVTEALGLDPGSRILWPKLYDTLVAMIADGAPLPPGATKEVLDIVWAQAERHEAALVGPSTDLCDSLGPGSGGDDGGEGSRTTRRRRCQEVLRLSIGGLVRRLLDNMEHSVQLGEQQQQAAGQTERAARQGHHHQEQGVHHQQQQQGGLQQHQGFQQEQHQQRRRQLHAAEQQVDPERREPRGGLRQEGGEAGAAAPSRLYLYSGHDSSVMPLLAVLGQPSLAWPRFTANVIFELWQAGVASGGVAGARDAVAAAVGRRGLEADRHAQHGASGSGFDVATRPEPEYWVRILYDGSPLVVPGVSNTGGWVPLGVLRQRVLVPYALTAPEHTALCHRDDITDLDLPRAPSLDHSMGRLGGGWESGRGRGLRRSETVREHEMRHALL